MQTTTKYAPSADATAYHYRPGTHAPSTAETPNLYLDPALTEGVVILRPGTRKPIGKNIVAVALPDATWADLCVVRLVSRSVPGETLTAWAPLADGTWKQIEAPFAQSPNREDTQDTQDAQGTPATLTLTLTIDVTPAHDQSIDEARAALTETLTDTLTREDGLLMDGHTGPRLGDVKVTRMVEEVGAAALGHLTARSDGRWDVADTDTANSLWGCPLDGDCILSRGHKGDCWEDRETDTFGGETPVIVLI